MVQDKKIKKINFEFTYKIQLFVSYIHKYNMYDTIEQINLSY